MNFIHSMNIGQYFDKKLTTMNFSTCVIQCVYYTGHLVINFTGNKSIPTYLSKAIAKR